jgi:hypothetical protein
MTDRRLHCRGFSAYETVITGVLSTVAPVPVKQLMFHRTARLLMQNNRRRFVVFSCILEAKIKSGFSVQ